MTKNIILQTFYQEKLDWMLKTYFSNTWPWRKKAQNLLHNNNIVHMDCFTHLVVWWGEAWWVCNEGGHVYDDKSDGWTDELILHETDTN